MDTNAQSGAHQGQSIFRALDRAAELHPQREFVRSDDGSSMQYAEFRRAVELLAETLHRTHGVGQGARIALHFGNTIGFCLATLAVLRLGATVVPLNTKLQQGECATLVGHVQPSIILSESEHLEKLRGIFSRERVVDIAGIVPEDGAALAIESAGDTPELPAAFLATVAADDPAFIMYTSGTTGAPKGVVITHANILRACVTYRDGFGLSADDLSVIAVPIFHGTGLFGQFFPLLFMGGRIVLQRKFSTPQLLELLASSEASHFIGVPTMYTYLLQQPELARSLGSLRMAGVGGAPLPVSVALEMSERLPWVRLFNTYGLTETTSPATMLLHDDFVRKAGAIGRATPGMRARIVDEASRAELSVGVVGELELSGELLTPGYLDSPEQTQAAITDGWLRTGDSAYMDPDGVLFLQGRIKDMISRGGEKIYPIEVEDVLVDHPAVVEANVFGVPHATYGEAVHAQVVLAPGTHLDEGSVVEWCGARLAKYKTPATVEFVTSIPKNASGKPLKPKAAFPRSAS